MPRWSRQVGRRRDLLLPVAILGASIVLQAGGNPAQRGPAAPDDRPALAPEQALQSFVLEPGYRLDLVAAEPLVQDPVAIAFDERGRLYVAENRGYPDPLEGEPAATPSGVIARLTDTDGDGRFDTRTDFATGLTYPNGVMVWNGGVFVTVAPDLLYLKDTDDDGIADERRVALTGFNANRTAQIRFSHPTLGPDGWIYLTSGLNGGRVRSPQRPDVPPVEFASSDSRYHPLTGAFELVGGQGQYGLTFDDEGRRFICANRHPVWHVVLEPRHLQRNPALAFSDTVQEVSTVGAEAIVWPLTRDLTTASFHPSLINTPHAGTFTSASGVHIHGGDALPAGHAGSIFIAESAQNLVQRQVRERVGVTFRSRPARDGVEFLASRDSWFRPVHLANGPDGALYVVDMYRKDIDHPAYVPEESRRLFDFTAGRGMGRIYRVAAVDAPPMRHRHDLADADPERLVAALGDRNSWRRNTAQRLLCERRVSSASPALRALLQEGAPLARLHALWTLDALGTLADEDLVEALADASAAVREHAVRLSEGRLAASRGILDAVVRRGGEEDARVRLAVALAIGGVADERAARTLAAIAARDGADRWLRAAVFGGLHGRVAAFLSEFQRAGEARPIAPAVRGAVMQDLGRLYGASESPAACLELLSMIADPGTELSWQPPALAGLAEGLRARGLVTADGSALLALVSGDTPEARLARERLHVQFARARELALLDAAPPEQRVPAIDLLAQAGWPTAGDTLARLLDAQQPAAVQMAGVRAIGRMREPGAAATLVSRSRWSTYSPRVRDVVLTTMLGEERLIGVLLDAVAQGGVPPVSIGAARAGRLTAHRDAAIRERAQALFSVGGAGAATADYERLRAAVARLTGDARRGHQVYATQCVACHTFRGSGGRVGPDLSGIGNQPVDALLLHIVVPDHEITPGYESYGVETRDGLSLLARLESETAGSVTLRDGAGQAHTILRANITSITAAPGALMPPALGDVLDAQELADLIRYLKSDGASGR